MSRWVQEKKKDANRLNASASRNGHGSSELEHSMAMNQISSVECFLSEIPAEVLASRAVECKSFARALYYWEQYIRQQKDHYDDEDKRLEPLYERLQDIYTQIDEPDGIEGISAHLQVLNIDQQVLEHRKAGRWTAVQSWYELLLQKRPQDTEVQFSLLTSLRESGQHGPLPLTRRLVHINLPICRCPTEPDSGISNIRTKHHDVKTLCRRGYLGNRQMGQTCRSPCWTQN